jgi:hypothetical protein
MFDMRMRLGFGRLKVVLAVIVMTQVGTAFAARPDEREFPTLAKSWDAFQSARARLQQAEEAYAKQGTLGGHGLKAIAVVDAARAEIEMCVPLAARNARAGGRPGTVTLKAPPRALPTDAKYPLLGDARLNIEWAMQWAKDAGEYHAPIGALGGHALKATEDAQRALQEIDQAEAWIEAHKSPRAVTRKPSVPPAPPPAPAQPAAVEVHQSPKPEPSPVKALPAAEKSGETAPAELPTVSTVERDMAGAGERDTAARIVVALGWLAAISDRVRAHEYAQARDRHLEKQRIRCQDEPGCDPSVTGAMSRFFTCRNKYEVSPKFLRAFIDKYVPTEQQEGLGRVTANWNSDVWVKALALPPGGGDAAHAASLACTTPGQFKLADDQAAEAREEKLAANEQRRASSSPDVSALALALADGRRAKKANIDTVYGVPMGVPLSLPDCDAVGHREKDLMESVFSGLDIAFNGKSDVKGSLMVSPENCLLVGSDGSTTVVWAKGTLPTWAASATTVMTGNVLVSVRFEFDSVFEPPSVHVLNGPAAVVAQNQAQEAFYEAAWKHGPQNVAAAQKALRNKYGPPNRTVKKGKRRYYKTGPEERVEEPEWQRDGLHVKYTAAEHQDNVVIELESSFDSRRQAENQEERAVPKL